MERHWFLFLVPLHGNCFDETLKQMCNRCYIHAPVLIGYRFYGNSSFTETRTMDVHMI